MIKAGILPVIDVACYDSRKQIERAAESYDLIIVDGSPYADTLTTEMAKISDLIIFPTKVSIDDLEPQILLAREFMMSGVDVSKILFVVSQVPT